MLTCTIVWFRRKKSLLLRIHSSSTWKYPSGFTWVESCTYFFNMKIWKTLCILRLGGEPNWYAIGPNLANISNGPQYLGANLTQIPNLKELFRGFTLTNTCSPSQNYFWVLLRSAWLFCLSWAVFKLLCTCFTVSSSSFNKSGPNINLLTVLL